MLLSPVSLVARLTLLPGLCLLETELHIAPAQLHEDQFGPSGPGPSAWDIRTRWHIVILFAVTELFRTHWSLLEEKAWRTFSVNFLHVWVDECMKEKYSFSPTVALVIYLEVFQDLLCCHRFVSKILSALLFSLVGFTSQLLLSTSSLVTIVCSHNKTIKKFIQSLHYDLSSHL